MGGSSCLSEGGGLTQLPRGAGMEELPAGERKRAVERERDGWTEGVPLSGACSSDMQVNEEPGLGCWSRLVSQGAADLKEEQ